MCSGEEALFSPYELLHDFSHQVLLDLGGGEEGAGDGGAAVEVVAAQNRGVVSSRNLEQFEPAI